MKKLDISLGNLAIEFISISLAVVLGFAVSEWRDSNKADRNAQIALQSIASEVSRNCVQLHERTGYYEQVLAELRDSELPPSTALTNAGIASWKGVRPAITRSASFDVAISTGTLASAPFNLTDAIAQAYSVRSTLESALQQSMGMMMNGAPLTLGEAQSTLGLIEELNTASYRYFLSVGEQALSEYGFSCSTINSAEGT